MKRIILLCATALALSAFANAQPTTGSPDPTTGMETTGDIKEYTPGQTLVLESLVGGLPFKLSKSIVYADGEGKTVEAPALSKGQRVRVHYTKTDGDNLADRVTIIKE